MVLGFKRFVGLCVLCWSVLAQAEQAPLVFGVLNQQSPAKTAERWNPILRYLAQNTGLAMQLRMGATVQETDTMMGRGEFDLLFSNHNFRPEYDGVYRVLARWAGPPIYGVIAVNHEAPFKLLKELTGVRVAFPSKEAFAAYAVPMAALKEAGVGVVPIFAGSQEGALVQLQTKQVAAAAVNSRFLTQYAATRGLLYRELFVSAGYADLPILVHSRVSKEQVDKLRKVLLSMHRDPIGLAILEGAACPGFVPASEGDYDDQRRIYRKGG